MSVQATETSSAASRTAPGKATRWRFSADKSANIASKIYISSGIFWLLVSSLLTLMAQIKLLNPDWLAGWRWLTYGRIYPMAENAFVYGWLSMAGFGLLSWLWARLMQTKLRAQLLLVSGAMLWNLGVAIGITGIMTGFSRGMLWLDMPVWAYVVLLLAVPPVLQSMYYTTKASRSSTFYISAWYLAAAGIWILFLLVSTLIPIQDGVAGATYGAWYSHNLIGLWVLPIALAACYYFVPKLTGRPIYSKYLAPFGFWTYALFTCWSSADQLIGSPIPQWLSIISIGFSLMMLIPVSVITVNLLMGFKGMKRPTSKDPSVRFVFFGIVSFALYGLLAALHPLRWWNEITQFTLFQTAHVQLGIYAFATMAAFGGIYYIMPRLSKRPWPRPGMIRIHYALSALGISLFVLAYWFGGIYQGTTLMDSSIPIFEAISPTWLWLGLLGTLSASAGHLLFAYLFYGNLVQSKD